MTVTFDISSDLKKVTSKLIKKHKEQVPFAAANALNSVAFRMQKFEKIKAQKEIDRPIPFTLRGFRVKKASKTRLEAKLSIAPIQWEYLQHIVQPSVRYPKKKFIGVPAKGNIKLNKYGNVPGKAKGLLKNKSHFIATIKGVTGVWERGKTSKKGRYSSRAKNGEKTVRLIYRFKSQARYKRTFNYFQHAETIINTWFLKDLERELTKAIRSAR